MSDPARLFQSLHIDDMPVTRSQSTLQGRGRNHRSGPGRHRALPPPVIPSQSPRPPADPIQSYGGRQYYTEALSPMSAQRATEGLESNFSVRKVQRHDSGRETYYAFEMRTPVAVRIYEPSRGRDRVECSCETHRVTQSECAHIYALFAGLHALFTDQQETTPQTPAPTEISLTSQLGQLCPLIQQHLTTLPQELSRICDVDLEPDDPDFETRADNICDIVSSFDEDMTPVEFRQRFVEDVTSQSLHIGDSILVQGNLPATIFRLAFRDDAFYNRLQQVVPRDVRAIQYYKTQDERAQKALKLLSRHSEMGPARQEAFNDGGDVNVPSCARYLRSIVNEMCQDRQRRTSVAALDKAVLNRLAEVLARLIGQVVTWDRDIYGGPQWNNSWVRNESSRNRNLFVSLIGDPPSDPGDPAWMSDLFVVDRLHEFPPSEWSRLLEFLTTIKDAIEEKDMDALPGASEYVARIDEMVQGYTATADEPSSSSVQVPRRP